MKQTLPAALSAIALALVAGSAHAQVVNGNFSGLAGWTTDGDAASVATDGSHLVLTNAFPGGGDDSDGIDHNVSGSLPVFTGSGAGTGSLEDFLGVDSNAFDVSPTLQAYEGSAAMQTFTVAAGGLLSFQWNLSTVNNDPTTPDAAFVVIDGKVLTLGTSLGAIAPASGGEYPLQSGWASWSALLDAGSHTIAFGVVDINSFGDSSALSVRDVGVSAVPESSTIAMLAAGLGLLAFQRRRRSGV